MASTQLSGNGLGETAVWVRGQVRAQLKQEVTASTSGVPVNVIKYHPKFKNEATPP
jgi:hypothetical protein